MIINPKTFTLDANDRSRLIAACELAMKKHEKARDKCSKDRRAHWDHDMAAGAIGDLITRLSGEGE